MILKVNKNVYDRFLQLEIMLVFKNPKSDLNVTQILQNSMSHKKLYMKAVGENYKYKAEITQAHQSTAYNQIFMIQYSTAHLCVPYDK